jgi:hypothetical protein
MKESIMISDRFYPHVFPEESRDGLVELLKENGYAPVKHWNRSGNKFVNEDDVLARIVPVKEVRRDGFVYKLGAMGRPFLAFAHISGYRLATNNPPGKNLDEAVKAYYESLDQV